MRSLLMRAQKLLPGIILLGMMILTVLSFFTFSQYKEKQNLLPIVAIANFGPHASLEASIAGIKAELAAQGFIEHQTVKYHIQDVGFDAALIPQMIAQLKNKKPQVMVVLTTPVAQYAKNAVQDIPLVFTAITDPLEAGLLRAKQEPHNNMTGSSDQQDLHILLQFSKKLLPTAKKIGLLYATSEANDIALVKMMEKAALTENMQVVAIPVDQARDVPLRVQGFKNKVDVIYVGTSGPIQPTLPAIAAQANKMGIPVLNVCDDAVTHHQVLASFGVQYHQVGVNAGKLITSILNGVEINQLPPLYPTAADHYGFISQPKAQELGVAIPEDISQLTIVSK